MLRRIPVLAVLLLLLLLLLLAAPAFVRAEEEEPTPALAVEAAAKEALQVFKPAFKPRGVKGDEKTALQEVAMRKLARTQHPLVADQLFKLTRDRNPDIRTLALMYLGQQKALPGYAGPLVVKALEQNKTDAIFTMFAIEAIETLDYRGAVEAIRALTAHKDEGVRKVALLYIGDAQEWRLIDELLKLMKELKIDQGWKTEGHEVRYDSGAEGDADQKMAEKIYHDKYGNSARKARSGGRAMRDMKPVLLEAMKSLTGEDFFAGASAKAWAEEHQEDIEKAQKALEKKAEQQAAEAEALAD